MIPVAPQAEPADFDLKVRRPGKAFLNINPNPRASDFKRNAYWKLCLPELRSRYGRICAYSSIFMPIAGSVDHYKPKSQYRLLTYEWSNYRLALEQINNNKGESVDVLDPFTVQIGWFTLDAATLWVHPAAGLNSIVLNRVQRSIDILGLNDEQFVKIRFQVFTSYIAGDLSLTDIATKYPFIAAEINRQGVKTKAERAAEAAAKASPPNSG